MESNFPITIKITRTVVALLADLTKDGYRVGESNFSVSVDITNAFGGNRDGIRAIGRNITASDRDHPRVAEPYLRA